MNTIFKDKKDSLRNLCAKYHVTSLELFGSATDDSFNPDSSDLDFLVQFEPCSPSDHYEYYFGLLESLKKLFAKKIDLVEKDAIKNPYFIKSVNESRSPIYGA